MQVDWFIYFVPWFLDLMTYLCAFDKQCLNIFIDHIVIEKIVICNSWIISVKWNILENYLLIFRPTFYKNYLIFPYIALKLFQMSLWYILQTESTLILCGSVLYFYLHIPLSLVEFDVIISNGKSKVCNIEEDIRLHWIWCNFFFFFRWTFIISYAYWFFFIEWRLL